MRVTSMLSVPLLVAALCGLGAASAAANPGPDNAQGQVERGPEHANSICSFSGLNDVPLDPEEGGRVQSYGQLVSKGLKAEFPSPSLLCNGHKFPYPEAFGGGE